jgi:protein-S-isoprenylcysteine O-methyltransferase Ste14
MQHIFQYLFYVLWISYLIYWWTMSRNVKETVRTESSLSRLTRSVSIILAALLLCFPKLPIPFLDLRFLPLSNLCFWIGAIITAGGLYFSVWARRYLGKNWSQAVTIKEDHKLITNGPYSLARHPIYTGLLFGFVGTTIALGEWRGVIAVALVFGVLLHKLKLEEKWLHEQFGESYEIYCQRVSALVPFII